jgi:hypothetical protein
MAKQEKKCGCKDGKSKPCKDCTCKDKKDDKKATESAFNSGDLAMAMLGGNRVHQPGKLG